MTIEKYQELTGNTVSDADKASVTAAIRRSKSTLESMLGYTLSRSKTSVNDYEEVGKSKNECGCYETGETLNDPDEVEGAYRLFRFNKDDKYFEVDPFITLHKVKLVYVKPGEEPNGITIKTFDEDTVRVIKRAGISKYIEKCDDCLCFCECTDCVQIAVDADWLFDDCLPDELLYIWCDMVDYATDCKADIKSETLGPHSYTKFDTVDPQEDEANIAILKKYAGPNGTLSQSITV